MDAIDPPAVASEQSLEPGLQDAARSLERRLGRGDTVDDPQQTGPHLPDPTVTNLPGSPTSVAIPAMKSSVSWGVAAWASFTRPASSSSSAWWR